MLNMTFEYLTIFKSEYNKTKNIAQALRAALKAYNSKEGDIDNDIELYYFYTHHLDDAQVGSIIKNYEFRAPLPDSLVALFNFAKIIENTACHTQSPLIIDCENAIAAGGANPKDVFLQTKRLEIAITSGDIEPRHIENAMDTLTKLANLFDEKLVTLILSANSEEDLIKSFENSYICDKKLAVVSTVKTNFDDCIKFFSQEGFFSSYYSLRRLSDKFDKVIEFYNICKQNNLKNESEILKILYYEIINKVFQPYEKKLFELGKEGITLNEGFAYMEEWTINAWGKYHKSKLLEILNDRVNKLKEKFYNWEELRKLESGTKRNFPMYEIYSLNYLNPEIDPIKKLQQLKEIKKQEVQIPVDTFKPQ